MNVKTSHRLLLSLSVTLGALVLLWIVGSVMAQAPEPGAEAPVAAISPAATVSSRISYQGVLTEEGVPVTGVRNMAFLFWSDAACTAPIAEAFVDNVPITDGLFSTAVDVPQGIFSGQGLWLTVEVATTRLGCEEILPVPYALSLRPGAQIERTESGNALELINTATGAALSASSTSGFGVYGYSEDSYAVYGAHVGSKQARGYGGYFTSNTGVGVYGYSNATESVPNQYTPGVYGRSLNGVGVYGVTDSVSSYAGRFEGVSTTSPGVYIRGNLVATGSKSGYIVDVCLNDGPDPLEVGDLVAVVGVDKSVIGEIPVMRVRKATDAMASAVAGVVDQRFLLEGAEDDSLPHPDVIAPSLTEGTAVEQGEYVSIVTHGAFKAIKVDASYGAIQPGDLLVASPNPGHAMRSGANPPVGTVIGKALDSLEAGTGIIPILVMLQ
jgi:hypothetical protein